MSGVVGVNDCPMLFKTIFKDSWPQRLVFKSTSTIRGMFESFRLKAAPG